MGLVLEIGTIKETLILKNVCLDQKHWLKLYGWYMVF